jgi:alpha-L-rhamnosidase
MTNTGKNHTARRFAACLIAAVAMLSWLAAAFAADLTNLRCEYRTNPLGIDVEKPRLSWVIQSARRGERQTAYQVLLASSETLLKKDKGDLWDSGKVASDQSIQVEYAGKPLESRMVCHWKVRVWDKDGKASDWSKPALWTMGLLKPEDWQAKWIKAEGDGTSPWLRKEFTLAAAPDRATAFVNVKGYCELYVNGKKVGDDVLSPAVAVYRKRTLYNTYDISKYLHAGNNCVGVWLGLGLCYNRKGQEHMPIARVQLDMSVGGQRIVVGTDPTWTWMDSSHTEFGWGWCGNGRENIDARRYIDGWNEVGCTNGSWKPVEEFAEPTGVATAQACPPNRITKKFPMVKCTAMTTNMFELDFGTNLNGWFTLKLPKLEAGHKVTIRFADKRLQTAEEEKNSGVWKLNTDHGPAAYTTFNQQLEFISAGKPGEQIWPKHNYFSFRYAIVEGLPAAPAPGDAEALMIESDLESAGTFECSNNLFNRINQVNLWTIRCLNLGGYMVDSPHRERMGYGDGQNMIDTHIMYQNASAFYGKWAVDWLDDQNPVTGKSVQYAPNGACPDGTPDANCWFLWGGMVDVMPWKAYLYYGDRRLLERAYEPMVRYPTVYLESFYPEGGIRGQGGDSGCDWVAPRIGMTAPPGSDLFVNCYRVYLMDLLAKSADVLGRTEEAKRHRVKGDGLKALINAAYYKRDERLYDSDRQLSQAMPLLMGLVPDGLREGVIKNLDEIIRGKNKGHLDTGMLGTYFLLRSLREMGRNDLAFSIVSQEDFPGWGYLLSQGMTTFGEQWDGIWSQIHSCFASVGSWFYQGLAGILPDESGPGFKKIIIKPAVVGDLTWVKCSYDSIHGRIVSNWKLDAGKLTMEVTIPMNTTATVYVPANDAAGVTESGKPAAKAEGVKFLRMENSAAVYEIGSGSYRFQSAVPDKKSSVALPAVVSIKETNLDTSAGANGSEIQSSGTLVRAYYFGDATDITVHGVLFKGAANAAGDRALSGSWGGSALLDFYPAPSDANYKKLINSLLQAPADTPGVKPTLTIAGLTTGHTYRLQIICNLPRNGVVEVAGSKHQLTNGDVKTPVLLTAAWQATNDTLNIRWIAQGVPATPVHFTAYALHDLGEAKVDGK